MSRYGKGKDRAIYSVIVNHAGQYSLWPAHDTPLPGWTSVGKTGPRHECLDYISTLMPAGESQPDGRVALSHIRNGA